MADLEPTAAGFANTIHGHGMQILLNNGIYRHLRFKRPGTTCFWFDIVTVPGALIYTGDMGGYTFRRLEDMFEFFRSDRGRINPSYWAEKVEAVDRNDGITKFSEDKFNAAVKEHLSDWIRSNAGRTTRKERRDLYDAVLDEVLGADGDVGGFRKQCAAHDFSHKVNDRITFYFQDFWERNVEEYSYRFIWCCRALVWAIAQFDAATAPAPSDQVTA